MRLDGPAGGGDGLEVVDLAPRDLHAAAVELVVDDPAGGQVAEVPGQPLAVPLEQGNVSLLAVAALRLEPLRVRIVANRDPRLDSARRQPLHQVAVAPVRLVVALPLLRLDAAPFDREAVCLVTQLGNQVHVLPVQLPMVACLAGGGLAGSPAPLVVELVVPFLAVDVISLDLVPRRGRAEEEVVGEPARGYALHHHLLMRVVPATVDSPLRKSGTAHHQSAEGDANQRASSTPSETA